MLNVSIVMLPDKTWPAAGTQLHLGCGKCSTVLSLPQQKLHTSRVRSCARHSALNDREPDV